MNDKGYSWPEALLTLTIVMVIFGTLLPFASFITSDLQAKKSGMYAAETAYQGALSYRAYGMIEGTRQVDGIAYDWMVDTDAICVSYEPADKVVRKCITY